MITGRRKFNVEVTTDFDEQITQFHITGDIASGKSHLAEMLAQGFNRQRARVTVWDGGRLATSSIPVSGTGWEAAIRVDPPASVNGARQEAYAAIDTERDYQDSLGADRTDGTETTVGEYITMLQYYQQELVRAWTLNPGDLKALDIMRKIGGIAVHCMEDHGALKRMFVRSAQ